jgi:GTP-binding protein
VPLTKADKLSARQQALQLEVMTRELPGGQDITFIPFSSQTGLGVEAVHAVLEDILSDEAFNI